MISGPKGERSLHVFLTGRPANGISLQRIQRAVPKVRQPAFFVQSLVLGDAVPKVLNLERQGTGGRLDYAPNVPWSICEITVAVDDKPRGTCRAKLKGLWTGECPPPMN